MSSIALTPETLERLNDLRVQLRAKSLDEVINHILLIDLNELHPVSRETTSLRVNRKTNNRLKLKTNKLGYKSKGKLIEALLNEEEK